MSFINNILKNLNRIDVSFSLIFAYPITSKGRRALPKFIVITQLIFPIEIKINFFQQSQFGLLVWIVKRQTVSQSCHLNQQNSRRRPRDKESSAPRQRRKIPSNRLLVIVFMVEPTFNNTPKGVFASQFHNEDTEIYVWSEVEGVGHYRWLQ